MKLEITTFMYGVASQAKVYREAIAEFRKVIDANRDNEPLCRRAQDLLVRCYMENGDYQQAIEQAEILAEKHAASQEALMASLNIGYCQERLSRWDRAEEVYASLARKLGAEMEPNQIGSNMDVGKSAWLSLCWCRLGRCSFGQSRYKEAIGRFEQALRVMESVEGWPSMRISPRLYFDLAEALCLMGDSYRGIGMNAEAVEAYQKVVAKYPDSGEWVARAREKSAASRNSGDRGRQGLPLRDETKGQK